MAHSRCLTVVERDDLIDHTMRYYDMGWSPFPMGGVDRDREDRCKVPAVSWAGVSRRRMPRDKLAEMMHWDRVTGVGVVMGDVSGGLATRDFDSDEARQVYARTRPTLAPTIPASVGNRGCNLWFYAPEEHYEAYEHPNQQGEYRGDHGHITIAPPSLHPTGKIYRWEVPPWGNVPHLDPAADGLWPLPLRLIKEPSGDTQPPSPVEHGGGGRKREGQVYAPSAKIRMTTAREILSEPEDGRYDLVMPSDMTQLETIPDEMMQAVLRYVPVMPGTRNTRILWMARWLKENYPLLSSQSLEPVFREWHHRATPVIRTKGWDVSWDTFQRLHSGAAGRVDGNYLDLLRRSTLKSPERLKRYCEFLAKVSPRGVFYLSDRRAGEAIGRSGTQARRILEKAQEDGWLVLHKRGVPHPTDRTMTTQYRLAGK